MAEEYQNAVMFLYHNPGWHKLNDICRKLDLCVSSVRRHFKRFFDYVERKEIIRRKDKHPVAEFRINEDKIKEMSQFLSI